MSKQKLNLNKVLLKDDNVNYYTKLMILLYYWDYYEDYYIPNRKIMNTLKIKQNNVRRLLKVLEENKVIHVFYKNRKRYFTFIKSNDTEEEVIERNNELYDYNWLED